jgi:hypothetical protein
VTKSKRIRWAGHVVRTGKEKWIEVFGGNSEGGRILGRPKRSLYIVIRMDLKDIG